MSESFLSRWARLKRGEPGSSSEPAPPDQTGDGDCATVGTLPGSLPPAGSLPQAGTPPAPIDESTQAESDEHSCAPEPELPPLETLTPQSDFRPFLQAGVAPQMRNAALKTLFSDPHFNVMDGLDVYIDDYNLTTPIAESTMRRLAHARTLRLFDDLVEAESTPGGSDAGPQAVSEAVPDGDASAEEMDPALLARSTASDPGPGEAGGDDSRTLDPGSNPSPSEST
ncbi:MAG TPA: DUF3306 domain-containing protein [Burkholderiaceae bacterium]|nr:DUF3306 domain-containing protein [Burkholderiaceae bacterium]